MKLLLNRSARPYLLGIAAGILCIAGCSGGRPLPMAGTGSGLAPSSHVTLVTGIEPEGAVPDTCSNPKKFKVCVKPGGHYVLGLTLTCSTISGGTESCGKVHWSTKMSHSGLKGTFKPDPGNPTKETISASKTIKLGHYHQTITAKCSLSSGCVFSQKAQIWVI